MRVFPKDWQIEKLDEVCSEIVDCINKTAPIVDFQTCYKMIRTTNVKAGRIDLSDAKCVTENTFIQWTRRILPQQNDVILTREAPLGEIGLLRTDEKVFLGQRTMIYRANARFLNQRFLYYSFLGSLLQSQIKSLGSGSTVEHMRVPQAEKLEILMPPLSAQKKIASILSAYDDLIENNKRRIALLEKMAEEIYREWFVRMRFPGHEQVAFHKGIPEGWDYAELGNLLEIKHGYAFKGEFFSQEPTPNVLLTPGNFSIGGGYKDDKLKYYTGSIPEDYILKAGDMIVTMTDLSKAGDTLGYPAFVPPSEEYQFLHNQRLGKVLIHDIKKLGNHFLYNVFCSEMYRYHVVGSATGSTVKHTAPERIKSFIVLIPDRVLMQKFEGQIDVIIKQIIVLNAQNNVLQKTRDRLLPRLISGKLTVEDLDIQFPPSMSAAEAPTHER
jgi:type I restriction enzyme, S subunit